METCQVSVILANAASVYILASIFYLVVTQSFGTPFKDAVNNYPELLKIKLLSAGKRRKTFFIGILFSIIGICVIRPFKNCGTGVDN
jgi:hypothetical protein